MIKVKSEYSKTVVAFGSNGFCLEKRTHEELVDLAIMSYNNHGLQKYFELPLPSLDDLKRIKLEIVEKKINNAWESKRQSSQ